MLSYFLKRDNKVCYEKANDAIDFIFICLKRDVICI